MHMISSETHGKQTGMHVLTIILSSEPSVLKEQAQVKSFIESWKPTRMKRGVTEWKFTASNCGAKKLQMKPIYSQFLEKVLF